MNSWYVVGSVAARAVVGLLLCLAGSAKIGSRASEFRDAVMAYRLLSPIPARLLATTLPFIEIGAGACLLIGLATPVAAIVGFSLIATVSLALLVSLARGRVHVCGCLGFTADGVRVIQWSMVYRNLLLMAALLFVASRGDGLRLDSAIGFDTTLAANALRLCWGALSVLGVIAVLIRVFRGRLRSTTSTSIRPEIPA